MNSRTSFPLRHRQPAGRRLAHGFTLMELIFTAALIGLLAVAATWFWVDGFTLSRMVNADTAAMAEGRAALDRMSREIREVKYNNTTDSYCIDSGNSAGNLTASRLVFRKFRSSTSTDDTFCGGTGGTADITVTIERPANTNNITLTYSTPGTSPTSGTLTTLASSFSMVYLDELNQPTTSGAALRFIELNLSVKPAGGIETPLKTVVSLRNN
jgi:prepilin-type N-terminal cleavage/methylation domain-containing protein